MESSIAICNYFIKKSLDEGTPSDGLKLLKLTYIAHGFYLAYTGTPLVDEGAEAWKYGPVFPCLYSCLKKNGPNEITRLQKEHAQYPAPLVTDQDQCKFLDEVWLCYGKYDKLTLSSIAHADGTPWAVTINYSKGDERSGSVIPNNLITKYYKTLLSKED